MVLMSEVTRILSQIEQGDPSAAEQLLPLVCGELRKLAAARDIATQDHAAHRRHARHYVVTRGDRRPDCNATDNLAGFGADSPVQTIS